MTNVSVSTEDDKVVIHILEKLDYSIMDAFKKAYEENLSDHYLIDFSRVSYIDSSGLGILLNMKRTLNDAVIDLIHCNNHIKRVLIISRFNEQFTIY